MYQLDVEYLFRLCINREIIERLDNNDMVSTQNKIVKMTGFFLPLLNLCLMHCLCVGILNSKYDTKIVFSLPNRSHSPLLFK